MKLPRYTASIPPPRSSGVARATNISALVRTSDIEKWQGIGAIGQELGFAGDLAFRASQNRRMVDDVIEWGTATSRVKGRFRLAGEAAERLDVSMDMPDPDDPNYLKTLASFSTIKRDQFLTEALKDIEKDVGKLSQGFSNPKNKADFENWYNDNYNNLANDVRSMYAKKLDSYHRSEMSRLSETAAENGDVATADRFVELMDKYELITPERAEALKKNNKVIADTSLTYRSARAIMDLEGYQKAIDYVMAQKIDIEIKKDIVGDIKFDAAQQQLEYDKYVEMTEQDFVGKYDKEQLSTDEIIASNLPASKKLMWKRLVDAQAEERLSGEVELNWDTYDKLQSMVEDYDSGKIDKEEVQEAISKEVGKTIPTTIARSLRDRLATKDKPDDPMNRSDVKRGLGVLEDLETAEVNAANRAKADYKKIREIRLKYQKKMDEFESWIKGQEKLIGTDIQNKISQMTQAEVEKASKEYLDRIWNFWVQSPFGIGYRRIAGIEKERKGPKTLEEFEAIVRSFEDEEKAKAYYEKWKNKW